MSTPSLPDRAPPPTVNEAGKAAGNPTFPGDFPPPSPPPYPPLCSPHREECFPHPQRRRRAAAEPPSARSHNGRRRPSFELPPATTAAAIDRATTVVAFTSTRRSYPCLQFDDRRPVAKTPNFGRKTPDFRRKTVYRLPENRLPPAGKPPILAGKPPKNQFFQNCPNYPPSRFRRIRIDFRTLLSAKIESEPRTEKP